MTLTLIETQGFIHKKTHTMKTLTFLCAVIGIVIASFSAHAAEPAVSKQYSACMDKSGGVTMGMIECITAENQRQDVRLNKAYKVLMADLTPARKTQLLEAQRAWIKFRDANCSFYLDPDGGTMARVSANDCVMTTTASRAVELEQFKQ